jgi:predicted TIM-barrel fold metal-dependent hydrolase
MKNDFDLFDAHTHLGEARHSGRTCTEDSLLQQMDRFGIDRSLAIPFPVVDDHRRQHDLIGRAVSNHPDRLIGAACLSPFLPLEEFRDEVRRCRERYGFRALKLQPQYHGLNPTRDASDFFFETAVANGLAVVCHTGSGLPFSAPSLFMLPARKFPDARIVLAHSGGGLLVDEAIVAALFCPNIYLELSTLLPHQVLDVLAHVPSSRLMIGSDLPENVNSEMGKILNLDIDDADKRNILSQTALRIFHG